MSNYKKTILLVEDDVITAETQSIFLIRNGYSVIHSTTGEKAIEIVNQEHIDLVLMDIDLGDGIDGTITAREILSIKEIPIIFLHLTQKKFF